MTNKELRARMLPMSIEEQARALIAAKPPGDFAAALPFTIASPCPFCGRGAEITPWHGGGPDKHHVGCIGADENGPYCETCPSVTGETLLEALANWNTRTLTPPSTGGEVEKLIERMRKAEQQHLRHIEELTERTAAQLGWDVKEQDDHREHYTRNAAIAIKFSDFQHMLAALTTSPEGDRIRREVFEAPQLTERVRDFILIAMNEAKISQRDLARQLKVTEPRVHEMLDGANLTLRTVEKTFAAIRSLIPNGEGGR